MPVEMYCPGCKFGYSFSEQLIGRTARCKKCQHVFTVGRPVVPENVEADDGEKCDDGENSGDRRKRKKKELRKREPAGGVGWKVAVGVVLFQAFVGGVVTLVVVLDVGADPGPDLIGEWTGAPEVRQALNEAFKGGPAIAKDFAGAILQKAADEFLAVTIQFSDDGRVFVSGNTLCIGVPGARNGSWEILERDGNVLTVRLDFGRESFDVRLAFRSRRNSFTFTRLDGDDQGVEFGRAR
jgi:hypothetical protein